MMRGSSLHCGSAGTVTCEHGGTSYLCAAVDVECAAQQVAGAHAASSRHNIVAHADSDQYLRRTGTANTDFKTLVSMEFMYLADGGHEGGIAGVAAELDDTLAVHHEAVWDARHLRRRHQLLPHPAARTAAICSLQSYRS